MSSAKLERCNCRLSFHDSVPVNAPEAPFIASVPVGSNRSPVVLLVRNSFSGLDSEASPNRLLFVSDKDLAEWKVSPPPPHLNRSVA